MRLQNLRRLIAGAAAAAVLTGCSTPAATTDTTTTSTVALTDATTVADALADDIDVETGDTSYDGLEVVDVTLAGASAETDSEAVSSRAGTVTIGAPGTYRVSGELDGQLVVDSAGDGVVRLVLDDVSITSETTAAVDIVDAESVVVVMADGSTNMLADATSYADTSEDAPTAALYSTADLTIGGTGSLAVTGNTNNGIVGKDGLVITGGTIEVTAVDDGIIGKDYLAISGGDIAVDAVDDGIKSDNTTDPGSGFVLVEHGSVEVSSQDDGIKGVQVLVAGGTIDVAGSTEAMEGSLIIIDGGDIELHSADDGVNVATSDDSASTDGTGGPPDAGRGGSMAADDSLNLVVNGGTLEVWASGDGLDSNGNATLTGGDLIVYGPTSDGNGALDVNDTFEITGGTLFAVGSAGMLVAPSTESGQGWIATTLEPTATAGSRVTIADEDGTELAAYTVPKDSASVVFSSVGISPGQDYTVTVAGGSTTVTAGEAPAGHRPAGR
ncbi:carbohydrate-binding domain-containing protein [Nocardioides sp. IC4_145]|uniref:carbohydrate-binding domain-containing protein n=1 Tax=Nocardioides sp. IC4_145 TaxID=2714037 RepID=UPI001407EBDF|nr:carbohydrate-binding domain-containing protein [Nocardioides sp. IC4_145]NHC21927.1 carbohydrate-binding domain-containing protein [Nocardioides sp. IC4_145]